MLCDLISNKILATVDFVLIMVLACILTISFSIYMKYPKANGKITKIRLTYAEWYLWSISIRFAGVHPQAHQGLFWFPKQVHPESLAVIFGGGERWASDELFWDRLVENSITCYQILTVYYTYNSSSSNRSYCPCLAHSKQHFGWTNLRFIYTS